MVASAGPRSAAAPVGGSGGGSSARAMAEGEEGARPWRRPEGREGRGRAAAERVRGGVGSGAREGVVGSGEEAAGDWGGGKWRCIRVLWPLYVREFERAVNGPACHSRANRAGQFSCRATGRIGGPGTSTSQALARHWH
jgi:hypothetical protein